MTVQAAIFATYMTPPLTQAWGPVPAEQDAIQALAEQARTERGEWLSCTVHLLTEPAAP